jgi:dimethylaniline monooxygenase (N-oxide forming)
MPNFPGQQKFKGEIVHISELHNREQLEGKKVLVVGYGKSATDASILAVEHADEATVVFRKPSWPVPAMLLGKVPFKYALFNRLTNAMLPLYIRPYLAERLLHSLGKPFVYLFWRLVEKLISYQCGLHLPNSGKSATQADLMPTHKIEYGGFSNSTMLPKPEFFEYIHSGRLAAERAEITSYTPEGVVLSNGHTTECDLVVLATGWSTDYGLLPQSVRDRMGFEDDGYYLYRQMLHPDVPGLVFIGSNAATYINILTHNLQARWLTQLLKGSHSLPSKDSMLEEIEAVKNWKRRIIPPSGNRAATLHLHMQHYHDELLADMGVSPWRKKGFLSFVKELISPYEPADYADVCSGEALEHVPGRKDVKKWDNLSIGSIKARFHEILAN